MDVMERKEKTKKCRKRRTLAVVLMFPCRMYDVTVLEEGI